MLIAISFINVTKFVTLKTQQCIFVVDAFTNVILYISLCLVALQMPAVVVGALSLLYVVVLPLIVHCCCHCCCFQLDLDDKVVRNSVCAHLVVYALLDVMFDLNAVVFFSQSVGCFVPQLPCEISETNFQQFHWFAARSSSTFNPFRPIFCLFQSVFNQFQQFESVSINLLPSRTQEFIDNRKWGKQHIVSVL